MIKALILTVFQAFAQGTSEKMPLTVEILHAQVRHEGIPINERAAAIGAYFLTIPYENGPLGEGATGEFDRDPLARFDKADCTTMVETVMALALSDDIKDFPKHLARIRYKDGKVDYASRNHFPETDWIPNNVAVGILTDVTEVIARDKTAWAEKSISKNSWYAAKQENELKGFDAATPKERTRLLKRWRRLGKRFKDETARLPYVPKEVITEIATTIPNGTIFSLVRADRPDRPVLISHQGLVIQKSDGTYLRHMATGRTGEDAPIRDYLDKYKDSSWKLLGLNLLALNGD
ncbi:MAG: N-acetylmuramoyl-L-alanine amidase-like domain-containing protein [Elusimicrobiota bacterium]